MSIIDHLLSVLVPYECLGCSAEGRLLCAGCCQLMPTADERCYRCSRPAAGALTCSECMEPERLHRVGARTAYEGIAKELVLRLKFSGAKAAAKEMASLLAPMLEADTRRIIVPVPTAASRVRWRGYDQAKLMARELSRRSGLPYADCLIRKGRSRQLGNSRQRRLLQLDDAFRSRGVARTAGREILLIDDVMTTGATLEAAAKALYRQGAEHISAVVFARA